MQGNFYSHDANRMMQTCGLGNAARKLGNAATKKFIAARGLVVFDLDQSLDVLNPGTRGCEERRDDFLSPVFGLGNEMARLPTQRH